MRHRRRIGRAPAIRRQRRPAAGPASAAEAEQPGYRGWRDADHIRRGSSLHPLSDTSPPPGRSIPPPRRVVGDQSPGSCRGRARRDPPEQLQHLRCTVTSRAVVGSSAIRKVWGCRPARWRSSRAGACAGELVGIAAQATAPDRGCPQAATAPRPRPSRRSAAANAGAPAPRRLGGRWQRRVLSAVSVSAASWRFFLSRPAQPAAIGFARGPCSFFLLLRSRPSKRDAVGADPQGGSHKPKQAEER